LMRKLLPYCLAGSVLACCHIVDVFGDTDGFARTTSHITPHVHLIFRPTATNAPYEGNSILIEQSTGLVVVDGGGSPAAGESIVNQIRAISSKPVRYLIYTHYHGDHNLGAGAFLAVWPNISIVSTDETRADMVGPPMDYIKTYSKDYAGEIAFARDQLKRSDLSPSLRLGWQQMVDVGGSIVAGYKDLKAYPATLTFHQSVTIADADMPVEVSFLGKANTNGDAVIWIPREKVICTGDIVVNPIPYAAASFPSSWIDVLTNIDEFDFSYLIPGHGEVQTDRLYVGKVRAALLEVIKQVEPLAKKGVKLEDVYKQTDFKLLTAAFSEGDDWKKQEFSSFFLHSIIKNVYFEATGQIIVQGTS
jgi:glyoxylase-like metal-dependent hydrolase (beta-lactamase superfamily II)